MRRRLEGRGTERRHGGHGLLGQNGSSFHSQEHDVAHQQEHLSAYHEDEGLRDHIPHDVLHHVLHRFAHCAVAKHEGPPKMQKSGDIHDVSQHGFCGVWGLLDRPE